MKTGGKGISKKDISDNISNFIILEKPEFITNGQRNNVPENLVTYKNIEGIKTLFSDLINQITCESIIQSDSLLDLKFIIEDYLNSISKTDEQLIPFENYETIEDLLEEEFL